MENNKSEQNIPGVPAVDFINSIASTSNNNDIVIGPQPPIEDEEVSTKKRRGRPPKNREVIEDPEEEYKAFQEMISQPQQQSDTTNVSFTQKKKRRSKKTVEEEQPKQFVTQTTDENQEVINMKDSADLVNAIDLFIKYYPDLTANIPPNYKSLPKEFLAAVREDCLEKLDGREGLKVVNTILKSLLSLGSWVCSEECTILPIKMRLKLNGPNISFQQAMEKPDCLRIINDITKELHVRFLRWFKFGWPLRIVSTLSSLFLEVHRLNKDAKYEDLAKELKTYPAIIIPKRNK